MNPILEEKLKALEKAQNYECWYLVKQPTAFDSLCYLVSFLKDYQQTARMEKLESYISNQVVQLEREKGKEISDNYRALRVAAFFGLICMDAGAKKLPYAQAMITPVFEEITSRCGGIYENMESYQDLIDQQIEKMFISSEIDEEYNGVRKEFRLYPVLFLYKILLELGKATGDYKITINEYRYLVATAKRYEEVLDTLFLISLLRSEPDVNEKLERFRTKFDNRLIQALKQLSSLEIGSREIRLKEECREETARKVYLYEQSLNHFETEDYQQFLCSSFLLFPQTGEDLEKQEEPTKTITYKTGFSSEFARNRIVFGAPGTGKSFRLKQDKAKLLGDGKGFFERVTFHPDYTYGQFVGTYKPVAEEGEDKKERITYRYVPGPFLRLYVEAIKSGRTEDPKPCLLIVEEINRARAAAVFGELFQLLDRNEFEISEYEVQISEDMRRFLAREENLGGKPEDYQSIRLPDNLFLWATMNSADQGVFPVDTAFKRRWEFEYIGIDEEQEEISYVTVKLGADRHPVNYNRLRRAVNDLLTERCHVNEDKLLGPYFLSPKVFLSEESFHKAFKSKVLMYLFEDAARMRPEELFGGCRRDGRLRYSDICKDYDEIGEAVFGLDLREISL